MEMIKNFRAPFIQLPSDPLYFEAACSILLFARLLFSYYNNVRQDGEDHRQDTRCTAMMSGKKEGS